MARYPSRSDMPDRRKPWEIIEGDSLQKLRTLPAASFHVVCCSPPYWALRSYLHKDHVSKHLELGSERSPDCFAWARGVPRCSSGPNPCYVCRMTDVFAEVKRVLRDDGTLWINCAGSHAGGGRGGDSGKTTLARRNGGQDQSKGAGQGNVPGWKAKDYVNVPALLSESLRADGWFLRAEIALTKVAPMPESCRDRPTRATEKLYLFSLEPRYYYDAEAERVAISPVTIQRDGYTRITATHADEQYAVRHDHETPSNPAGRNLWDHWGDVDDDLPPAVWEWRPEGKTQGDARASGGRHYATFPLFLPLRIIRLATSARGVCGRCGGPWKRVTLRLSRSEPRPLSADLAARDGYGEANDGRTRPAGYRPLPPSCVTLGWRPSCNCPETRVVPARVLDPFSGTATTGVAARLLGRHYVGIELSSEYAAYSRERLASCNPLDDAAWQSASPPAPAQPTLFDGEP